MGFFGLGFGLNYLYIPTACLILAYHFLFLNQTKFKTVENFHIRIINNANATVRAIFQHAHDQ